MGLEPRLDGLPELIPKGQTREAAQPHTCRTWHTEAREDDRLPPTRGPLLALGQSLTGRQPPGRAAGCSDLHWRTGFRPGKGGLCGGEGRWGSARRPGTQPTGTGPLPPAARQQLHWAGGVSVGAERPPSTVPTAPRPSPSCWGCSCPCQLQPWEPGRSGKEEGLARARCGGSGSCQI